MGICSSNTDSKEDIKEKTIKTCGDINSTSIQPRLQSNLNIKRISNKSNVAVRSVDAIGSTTMANPFPNLKDSIKGLVSKQRNRYKQDGYNLDLTYITPKIIAMGYPASNIEGVYRNHIDDVSKMLESKHKDHYKIYNLCSERSYDTTKFHNRVQVYPFDDHNPPKIDLIEPFCKDVHSWLQQDQSNVAVVHCKAGKGRTGTMICCYLLHSEAFNCAEAALSFYGQTRTADRKGVTIPSQVRYVNYYSRLIREKLRYAPTNLYITKIILDPAPNFTAAQGGLCFSISTQGSEDIENEKCYKRYKSIVYEIKKNVPNMEITSDQCLPLEGDIKVEFYSKSKLSKVKQLQFWFNTFFVREQLTGTSDNGFTNDNGGTSGPPCDKTFVLCLNRHEIDIVNKKDKQNRTFPSDFKVTLILNKVPSKAGNRSWSSPQHTDPHIVVPQDTPSESSEDSSEDDANDYEWDSVVEQMDPRGVGYRLLSECELATKLRSSSHDHLLTA